MVWPLCRRSTEVGCDVGPGSKHAELVCDRTWVSPNSLPLGVLNSVLRCVRPLCHCLCPPFSAGHVAFLFLCLPGLSLVSALFRWPCSISIHVSPRSVTAGVRPFRWPCSISIHLSPRSVTAGVRPFHWPCSISIHLSLWSVAAGVRPFPLVMQHFYSFPTVCC